MQKQTAEAGEERSVKKTQRNPSDTELRAFYITFPRVCLCRCTSAFCSAFEPICTEGNASELNVKGKLKKEKVVSER